MERLLTLDLIGVRGTGIVRIDLLGRGTLVQADESVKEIIACRIIVVAAVDVVYSQDEVRPRA
jgi:hypothetical protein